MVVAVEMSLSTWLVCAEVPGLERRAMKKMSVDEAELLSQLHRWHDEAEKRLDCRVSRICVAYEAGRDGFWLVRFLRGSGIEAHVMHSTSIPVNRDHRRAKTDHLDPSWHFYWVHHHIFGHFICKISPISRSDRNMSTAMIGNSICCEAWSRTVP